jgi:hypothetical protein
MPPTGSTFTDWQQVDNERRLLMDEDFSWSEPPARSRRRITDGPVRASARTALVDPEPVAERAIAREVWDQPTQPHSHFDEMMAEWNEVHGEAYERDTYLDGGAYADAAGDDDVAAFDHDDLASYSQAPVREDRSGAFDLSDPGSRADASGRRTVVITGHGDDRYVPAPRRRHPSSELRFHERSTFSPDRAGLWAVLLGLALLIGCIAH